MDLCLFFDAPKLEMYNIEYMLTEKPHVWYSGQQQVNKLPDKSHQFVQPTPLVRGPRRPQPLSYLLENIKGKNFEMAGREQAHA